MYLCPHVACQSSVYLCHLCHLWTMSGSIARLTNTLTYDLNAHSPVNASMRYVPFVCCVLRCPLAVISRARHLAMIQ
jgi:hypothetical protein